MSYNTISKSSRTTYGENDIRWLLQQKLKPKLENKKLTGPAMILFHRTVSNKTSKLLKKHNIRMVHIPKRKTTQMLRSAVDRLEFKFPGVYRIPCECRKVYVDRVVGLSRWGARNTNYIYAYTNLWSPRSGRTQHHHGSSLRFQCHHNINRISGYLNCAVKEAIEIHLNKNNFNIDGSFMFNQAWSTLTNMLLNGKHDQEVQVFKPAPQPSCLTTSYKTKV